MLPLISVFVFWKIFITIRFLGIYEVLFVEISEKRLKASTIVLWDISQNGLTFGVFR